MTMDYPRLEGEQEIFSKRPSMRAFFDGMALTALCWFFAVLMLFLTSLSYFRFYLSAMALLVGVIVLAFVFMRAKAYCFRLTNRRVIFSYSLGYTRWEEMPLESVTGAASTQFLVDRILKMGNVSIYSLSGQRRNMVFFGLPDHREVMQAILEQRKLRLAEVLSASADRKPAETKD